MHAGRILVGGQRGHILLEVKGVTSCNMIFFFAVDSRMSRPLRIEFAGAVFIMSPREDVTP